MRQQGDEGSRKSTRRDGGGTQTFEHAFERVFHEHHVSDYGIGEVSATEPVPEIEVCSHGTLDDVARGRL